MMTSTELSKHNNYFRFWKTGRELVPEIAYRLYSSKFVEPSLDEDIMEIMKINCGCNESQDFKLYLV